MLFLIKAGLVIGSIVGAYYLGKNKGQTVDKVRGITHTELADEIRKHLFVFEDIAKLNDLTVQFILREADNQDIAVALKMATEDVTQTIFSNISKRMQEMIKDDMDAMGFVRACDVEEAQQRIVDVVRKLEEEGEIIIIREDGEYLSE